MPYTLRDQYSRDIDWYFNDQNNRLIHVASGGGFIPDIISSRDSENEEFHQQVNEVAPTFDYEVNPLLGEILPDLNSEGRQLYLSSFIHKAKRGFISLDKTNLGEFDDGIYHVVAYPRNSEMAQFTSGLFNLVSIPISIELDAKPFDLLSLISNTTKSK